MKKRNLPFRQRTCSRKRHRFTTETQLARRISQRDQGVSVHLRVLRVSVVNKVLEFFLSSTSHNSSRSCASKSSRESPSRFPRRPRVTTYSPGRGREHLRQYRHL